ncbi:MAG: hypothetical protein WCJ30_12520 [Deltaproteobacteria bacterium]
MATPRRDTFALVWRAICLFLVGASVSSCNPTQRFESVCQLIRREVVETDAHGSPQLVDLELEWDACPGDQFQVVRGGAAFARCMARYSIGDALPVTVRHWWDSRGYYVWDLESVGVCRREIEPASEGSFEKSQECHDVRTHGFDVGFECNRRPFEQLVSVCPWMARQ